jgi:SNF2 family DNA or RNA helicase
MTFPYKNPPWEKQREVLRASVYQRVWFLEMEQGTGKTFIVICNIAKLWLEGKANALLVVAPNGVHENWSREEIPKHMPDAVEYRCVTWFSGRAPVSTLASINAMIKDTTALAILCINIDALKTQEGKKIVRKFLLARKAMMAVDESIDIATPGSGRARACHTLGKLAQFRRALNGTPGNPLQLYSQYKFLDDRILGAKNNREYQDRYAEWELHEFGGREVRLIKKDAQGVPVYKNIDDLLARKNKFSSRVRKDEMLDLPPKQYFKWFTYLSAEQRSLYKTVLEEYMAVTANEGLVIADNVLTRYLRLQQIACGYVGVEATDADGDPNPTEIIPGPQPRIEAMLNLRQKYPRKHLIWCRYLLDTQLLVPKLQEMGCKVAQYHGLVDDKQCTHDKEWFQHGDADTLVATVSKMYRGHTLTAAHHETFYSTPFGYIKRIQAEDRVHRGGLDHPVDVGDIIAHGTIDERIIRNLRAGRTENELVTQDPISLWI